MTTKLCFLLLVGTSLVAQTRHKVVATPSEEITIKVMVKQNADLEAEARRLALLDLQRNLGVTLLSTSSTEGISREDFEKYQVKLKLAYANQWQELNQESPKKQELLPRSNELAVFNAKNASASCLNNLLQMNLVPTKDAEGQPLVAYDLGLYKENLRYSVVDNYHEGFARICKDKKFGFLNICGKEAIEVAYDFAEPFNNGKAAVKKGQLWYFVDANGDESEEPLKDILEVKALKNGISVAKFKNGRYALINNDYNKKSKPLSAFFDEISLLEGDFLKIRTAKNYGIMQLDGSVIIEPAYNAVTNYWQGLFGVRDENNKLGYINQKGKVRITFDYSEIKTYPNGLAIATKDGNKWGVINKLNAKIVPLEFKEITFSDDNQIKITANEKENYTLNLEGDCLSNCEKFEAIRKQANVR